MYFPDLSPYRYTGFGERLRHGGLEVLNVGWLSKDEPYNNGVASLAFREKLMEFCIRPVALTNGAHRCEFCGEFWGNGEIHITSGKTVYVAPQLVIHYVTDHAYCPPPEFQEALLAAPSPKPTPSADSLGPSHHNDADKRRSKGTLLSRLKRMFMPTDRVIR